MLLIFCYQQQFHQPIGSHSAAAQTLDNVKWPTKLVYLPILIHKSRDSIPKRQALNRRKKQLAIRLSDHLFSIPSCRLHILDPLCRMRSTRVFILADKRIRVVLLLEITQSMVDLPMLGLVCPNVQQ